MNPRIKNLIIIVTVIGLLWSQWLVIGTPRMSICTPDIDIMGVDTSSSKRSFIAKIAGAEESLYSAGEMLGGFGKILSIRSDTIELQSPRSAKKYLLSTRCIGGIFSSQEYEERSYASQRSESSFPTRSNTHFEQIQPNVIKPIYDYSLDTSEFPERIYLNDQGNAIFNDPHSLGIGDNAIPYEENNVAVGTMLGDIVENSVLGSFGLEAGDIITHVNGQPVTSPSQLGAMIAAQAQTGLVVTYLSRDKSSYLQANIAIKQL